MNYCTYCGVPCEKATCGGLLCTEIARFRSELVDYACEIGASDPEESGRVREMLARLTRAGMEVIESPLLCDVKRKR